MLVPPSDHPLVECLETLHLALVDVFGNILHPEFDNDVHILKEKFMEAMRTQNPRMAPTVHVLVHHVPEYVRRTGVPLGPTPEQALESPHRFF